ncbi:MAG: hypothetical protein KDA32_12110 [Phycisphaerales bacterium]|nr:hypothetical protein [Phycisphaerales bacterium]
MKRLSVMRQLVAAWLALGAVAASADVRQVIFSQGNDPNDFPCLNITRGNIQFGQPWAKVFGLQYTPGNPANIGGSDFSKLPDVDRYPNDYFNYMNRDVFLTRPNAETRSSGILFSMRNFNNTDPNDTGTVAQMTFCVPLRDPNGRPIGGAGQRWIVFQIGKRAGQMAPDPNAPDPNLPDPNDPNAPDPNDPNDKVGRGGAWLDPPHTTLRAWAAYIKGITSNPGESEADFRNRVKDAIREAKRNSSRRSVEKYIKLVDDSGVMDPPEQFVCRIDGDLGQASVDVELNMLIGEGAYPSVAEMFHNFSVAITNEPLRASTDPANQPPGVRFRGAGSIDLSALGVGAPAISIGLGDPEFNDVVVPIPAFVTPSVPPGALTYSAFGAPVFPGDAATSWLMIEPTIFDPPGAAHMFPYDQAVGDTPEDVARDLALSVNATPHDGAYKYSAVAIGSSVMVFRNDGHSIPNAFLRKTELTESINEQLQVNPFPEEGCGPGCECDVDGDCDVDLNDLAGVLSMFGQPVAPNTQGDCTGDGLIDLADLAGLLSQFGNICGG